MTEDTLDDCVKDDMKEKWKNLVKPKWFAGSSMASQKEPGLLKEEAGISRGWFLALSPKCYILCNKEPCDLEKKIVAKENEFKTLELLPSIQDEPANKIEKKSAKGCNRRVPLSFYEYLAALFGKDYNQRVSKDIGQIQMNRKRDRMETLVTRKKVINPVLTKRF
ncbi:unnamed protein product, partial [Oikopleura dioica]